MADALSRGIAVVQGIFAKDEVTPIDNKATKSPGIKSGNPDLDAVFGGATSTDNGTKCYEVKGKRGTFEDRIKGIPGANQRPTNVGGTRTTLPDGTKVDTYPVRSTTGKPGFAITESGQERVGIKGSFVESNETANDMAEQRDDSRDESSQEDGDGGDL